MTQPSLIEPWFDPNHYAWIPGTAIGLAAGLMGALAGFLASRGRARNLVLRAWLALVGAGVALVIAGIIAVARGQPWGVWFGLLLPGLIATTVVGVNTTTILKRYREVEERRLAAKDLL